MQIKCFNLGFLIAMTYSFISLSLAQQVEQKLEKQQNISSNIILNQKLLFNFSVDIFKHAYFMDFASTSDSSSDFCQVKQRTIESSAKYEQNFDFNEMKLSEKDEILVFQLIGSDFISVSKQGMVSVFQMNKSTQKLNFINSVNLGINETLDYQPIILEKDHDKAFIILRNSLYIFDLKTKKVLTTKDVTFEQMTKNAIYVDETLYVPLRKEGLLQVKIQVDVSDNIVIQSQSKISVFGSEEQKNECDVTDIYYSKKTNQFFVLDYHNGIFITDDKFTTLNYQISKVTNGYSFSLYENLNNQITIVVLSQKLSTQIGIAVYLKENTSSTSKYVHDIDQPIRLLEAERSKVIAFDHFALFQGKSTHALSYHSTFQNLEKNYFNRVPDFLTKEKTNTIIPLSKDFSQYNQRDNQFFVLSFFNQGYELSQLNVKAPQLICQPKTENDLGLYSYQVSFYSNFCPSENSSSNSQNSIYANIKQLQFQQLDIWRECLISQDITLDVENVIVDESNGLLIVIIALATVLAIFIFIFVIQNIIKKYIARIKGLEREFVQLSTDTKKFKYEEMEQEA